MSLARLDGDLHIVSGNDSAAAGDRSFTFLLHRDLDQVACYRSLGGVDIFTVESVDLLSDTDTCDFSVVDSGHEVVSGVGEDILSSVIHEGIAVIHDRSSEVDQTVLHGADRKITGRILLAASGYHFPLQVGTDTFILCQLGRCPAFAVEGQVGRETVLLAVFIQRLAEAHRVDQTVSGLKGLTARSYLRKSLAVGPAFALLLSRIKSLHFVCQISALIAVAAHEIELAIVSRHRVVGRLGQLLGQGAQVLHLAGLDIDADQPVIAGVDPVSAVALAVIIIVA